MVPAQKLGIHLSSLEREGWRLDGCLAWASRTGIDFFEAGPKITAEWSRADDVRRLVDRYAVRFVALEVNSGSTESMANLPELAWAKEAGCEQIILTGLDLERLENVGPEIAATAERSGIAISVDLSGDLASRPDELSEMLERIGSPFVRVAIDTGRVRAAGYDPLELTAAVEGHLGHFRIRTGTRETNGETNGEPVLRSIIELLLDGDYRGGLGIMDESGRAAGLEERVAEVRRALRLTRTNRHGLRRGSNV